MPWLVNEQYSVTYSASTDAFLFDFVTAGIQTYTIRRVGFSYASSNTAPDGVTFYSNLSSDYLQFDGLTVRSSNCTSPIGANPLALYNAILALYVVGPPVVPTELQSFRHSAEIQTLNTGSGDPAYVDWYTNASGPYTYERNSESHFSFPDAATKRIETTGVYDYHIVVMAHATSATRAWTMFLDTTGDPMSTEPRNPGMMAVAQVAYPPTWQSNGTLQSCTIHGTAEFQAGTNLRVVYVTEEDLTTVEDYTFWSMTYKPETINAGPQGEQGLPGNDGADGAPGVVQSVLGANVISVTGTLANPVVGHGLIGTSGVITYPYQVTRDAYGHVSNITTMAAPFNAIIAGTDISVSTGGVAPTRSFSIAHQNSGVTAGTYTNIASLTTDNRGHTTAIVSGGAPELLANKNQPNGYAGLGPLGKIAASQIPAIAITNTTIVATQADLVTITTAEVGDIGIVTADPDNTLEGAWILQTDPYSTLSNWVRLMPPGAGLVYTVNGQVGPNVVTANNQPILYQLTSLVSPGDKIIRRIGNANESSYVDILNDVDITSSFDIHAQALFEVLLSAYGGVQALYMASAYTELNLGSKPFTMTNLQSGTASDVLYYDSGTGLVTYGSGGAGSARNYAGYYFNDTYVTPANLPTSSLVPVPMDFPTYPLTEYGPLAADFAYAGPNQFAIAYTGATKTFRIQVVGNARFAPAGVSAATQLVFYLTTTTLGILNQSRQLVPILAATPNPGYTLACEAVVDLNSGDTLTYSVQYNPGAAGNAQLSVTQMSMFIDQLS